MDASTDKIQIVAEPTPNPSSIKFNVNRTLVSGAPCDFTNIYQTVDSPLARVLFKVHGVTGVFIGSNFVTVTLSENVWGMRSLIEGVIESQLSSGEPTLGLEMPSKPSTPCGTELEMKIMQVLDTEIRPALAMDGGDVVFISFENGIVKLQLRGACHSCPSATVTLKGGIERRLKEQFPEIISVESI
jgi:Fe-S cluster biogenesis protein NfuA